ncbi:SRPBCC family protein [Nocardia takedensis]
MRTTTSLGIGIATYLAGLAVGYRVLVRERCLTWGATAAEVKRPMPGDDLLPVADIVSTRAVAVETDPAAVWPWLVQIGLGRGGAYTYDWIENLLGLDMHSAEEILPQFQDLAPGDEFRLGESGPTLRVAVLEPERALVFASTDGHWIWSFGLYPEGDRTRLISRNRIALPAAGAPKRLFYRLIMEPGSWVMERKMLLGLARRAERRDAVSTPAVAEAAPSPVAEGNLLP